jgi:hypothetical protein
MREQTSQGIIDIATQAARLTGYQEALHPDDVPYSIDERSVSRRTMRADLVESSRSPSSTRRYTTKPPAREVHVIRHGPAVPRASRLPVPVQTRVEETPRTKRRFSWKVYLVGFVLLMICGYILMNLVLSVIHTISDNLTYGNPRTSQTDKDVGHGGVSHFTVENLGGHIIVIEVVNDDPSRVKVYAILTIDGDHADLTPATVSFEDVNHTGVLDMIVNVNNAKYIWPNNGKTFQQDKGGSSS